MSYCVIIRGPLGVGKTTVAEAVARHVGAAYVSIDQVLADHGLDVVEGECIPVENFVQANELALPGIRSALYAGQAVVVDGNFYHREALMHLQRVLDVPVLVFTLRAPVALCIERDAGRVHPLGAGAAIAVHQLVSRFDQGVAIDTAGQTVAQTVEAVMDRLRRYQGFGGRMNSDPRNDHGCGIREPES